MTETWTLERHPDAIRVVTPCPVPPAGTTVRLHKKWVDREVWPGWRVFSILLASVPQGSELVVWFSREES